MSTAPRTRCRVEGADRGRDDDRERGPDAERHPHLVRHADDAEELAELQSQQICIIVGASKMKPSRVEGKRGTGSSKS